MLKEIFHDSLKISKITMIWFDFFRSEMFLFLPKADHVIKYMQKDYSK